MQKFRAASCSILAVLSILALGWPRGPAMAQGDCNQEGKDLLPIPEISSQNGRLRAEIKLTNGKRTLWGIKGDTRCLPQQVRVLTGHDLLKPGANDLIPVNGEPIPAPTLRVKVGDLIQIKFLNDIDTQSFAGSLDQALSNQKNTTGCDEVYTEGKQLYPGSGKNHDIFPNCLHGSSTSNIHFHGTHTTPNTTGDNVLLNVRPALRSPLYAVTGPSEADVNAAFDPIFSLCEKNGSPVGWDKTMVPDSWINLQQKLLVEYDAKTPSFGNPGPLPKDMQLWPVNKAQIESHLWPQYHVGAFPYCFRLADTARGNDMGQAPGTHWYHAHKHGSTALNVANGMEGALIIEGEYDAALRRFYNINNGPGLREQVLMIQQLSSTPFPALNPLLNPRQPELRPVLSVNGRLDPVVKMRPGEVQLWRVVNGAFRDAVQLQSFEPKGGLAWRQIAQDGVQFHPDNYQDLGTENRQINLAPANRADLLVKAPAAVGKYDLIAMPNVGLPQGDPDLPTSKPIKLLTVSVEGQPVEQQRGFITKESFPKQPDFLHDIDPSPARVHRTLTFAGNHYQIDNERFNGEKYSQIMALNSVEEWKIENQAPDKSHPFHIHINPFQVTEIFEPNDTTTNTTDPAKPCYVDPLKPETWKSCAAIPAPYVWWDTFGIPMAKTVKVTDACTSNGNTNKSLCPAAIQPYVDDCPAPRGGGPQVCTVTIPGYFKMRTKFADFPGTYVIHCHILIHEDRGMMQMVEVVPDHPPYKHH